MFARVAGVLVLIVLTACSGFCDPLISSNTQVILLNGVPGDAECENAYAGQLQDWVSLSRDLHARRMIVFCDQPASAAGQAGPHLQVSKANRENFLQLPSVLGKSADRLTFIIWGHGGQQGDTAVFHVRGPRITPDDIAELAEKLGKAHTTWILMFRGSGAFARKLVGKNREILSSDSSTVFANDPTGMPLLTKALRQDPGGSLASLARNLAVSTANWYSQRHLAAAEEPTLWLNGEAPQQLATTELATASSQTVQPTEVEVEKNDKQPAEPRRQAADRASTELAAIKRVRPEAFPQADAVILRSSKAYMLGTDPALVTENDQFIQVLKRDGKRFGDFDVTFFPPREELEFLVCEVLRPDGQRLALDPDAVGIAKEQLQPDYDAGQRKFFSLPGVVPGSVLHVRYRSSWKDYPMPRISMEIPIAGALPVVEASIEVRVPKDWPMHCAVEGLKSQDPVITSTGYTTSHRWRWTDLAPDAPEPLSGPHHKPSLSISTYRDWAEFSSWYRHITKLTDEVSPEVAAKAQELTRDAKTDREKVRKLYEYVTALRYVAVPLGINSVRPHAAAHVLQNQFGDCKDKANLLNAMLRSLNIPADLVLVPRFKEAYDALPGFAFNHAISRVTLEGQSLWLDSTDEVCRFGFLPPGDCGHNVLVIDGQTTGLTRLPSPEPAQQRLRLRENIDSADRGSTWTATLAADSSGCVDYQMRNDSRENPPGPGSASLLNERYRPVSSSFALERQTNTPVSDKDQNFQWHGTGTVIGLVAISGNQCTVHCPFWLPKEWEFALNRRQAPLFLNDGYPLVLEEEIQIGLPPGTEHLVLPPASHNDQGSLHWDMGWSQAEDGKLVAKLHTELRQGHLSREETAQFQKQARDLFASLAIDAKLSLSSRLSVR
jgi:hypothetical protein